MCVVCYGLLLGGCHLLIFEFCGLHVVSSARQSLSPPPAALDCLIYIYMSSELCVCVFFVACLRCCIICCRCIMYVFLCWWIYTPFVFLFFCMLCCDFMVCCVCIAAHRIGHCGWVGALSYSHWACCNLNGFVNCVCVWLLGILFDCVRGVYWPAHNCCFMLRTIISYTQLYARIQTLWLCTHDCMHPHKQTNNTHTCSTHIDICTIGVANGFIYAYIDSCMYACLDACVHTQTIVHMRTCNHTPQIQQHNNT